MLSFLRAAVWLNRHHLPRLAMIVARLSLTHRVDGPAAFHLIVDLAIERGEQARAERLCHARLGVIREDRDALLRLGHLLLDDGRIAEAVVIFQRVDAVEGRRGAVTAAFLKQHLDIARARRGESYYRWLDNVQVETSYWTIMRDGIVYNDDVHAKNLYTSPFVRGRVSADGTTIVATLPHPEYEIADACIFVGGDDNYSHWLFRNVLKLATLDRAGLLYSYPWLVNSDLRSYQKEFIQLLGQRPEQLVKVGRHAVASCKRLLVPALHTSDQAIGRGVQWMRERFAHLLAAPAQATHRLLVSRRDVTRRSLLNEDELFEALAPLGFVRIVPGELSVVQQIAAFSSARIIVAAHGAALTNMLFAPRETAIVELTSTAIEHMSLFRKLARTTQQPIVTITSDDYPLVAGEIEINTPFRIDTRRVVRAVEDLI